MIPAARGMTPSALADALFAGCGAAEQLPTATASHQPTRVPTESRRQPTQHHDRVSQHARRAGRGETLNPEPSTLSPQLEPLT
eukprot:225033-Rhodomonas_salina.9